MLWCDLFVKYSEKKEKLIDKSGWHSILIQGMILVDSATWEVSGDYTWIPQHKREFNALVLATKNAVEKEKNRKI